jgi:hypothetical protein
VATLVNDNHAHSLAVSAKPGKLVSHRFAFHSRQALAWSGQRSLSGAGHALQIPHIGLSQVPVFLAATFQSHSLSARNPQLQQRLVLVRLQTIATPAGVWTC